MFWLWIRLEMTVAVGHFENTLADEAAGSPESMGSSEPIYERLDENRGLHEAQPSGNSSRRPAAASGSDKRSSEAMYSALPIGGFTSRVRIISSRARTTLRSKSIRLSGIASLPRRAMHPANTTWAGCTPWDTAFHRTMSQLTSGF